MTLLAHAITAAPTGADRGVGLRGRPLIWTDAGGLGVWSTDWEAGAAPRRDDMLEHHRVVERICAGQSCLPVRFGTVFADDAAARAAVVPKRAALSAAIERVAGKSELAVTLLWRTRPAAAPPRMAAAGPGRRFMEERRARVLTADAERRRAAEIVDDLVAELALDRALVWHEICTSKDVAASLAVLIPADQALAVRRELETLGARFGDVTAVVNGPWPPYSFATVPD